MPCYYTTWPGNNGTATTTYFNTTNWGLEAATSTTTMSVGSNNAVWYEVGRTTRRINREEGRNRNKEPISQRERQRLDASQHQAAEEQRRLERQRRAAEIARRAEELRVQQEAKERERAKATAHALLQANLSPEQRETFEKNHWFIVEGGKTKTKYRIRGNGTLVANVDVLKDDGKISHRLCAHCNPNEIPMPDHLLAQKLMLEISEDDFLRIANRHP